MEKSNTVPSLGDALIAATGIRHNLTIATRNLRDRRNFGAPLFNPFEQR
jgi:predicted nucleic acid-binding protein